MPEFSYYATVRPDMIRYLPPCFKRVLEVGCGAGGFSSQLKSKDVEVWGVEPSLDAYRLAQGRLTRTFHGTYDQIADQLPDNYFDLVVCNDVIEHMPDHDRFLQNIKSKMGTGAYLVGSLPNMRFITALAKLLVLKDWAYREEGILDRTHLRFFTQKSIQRSLTDSGYRVEALAGTSGALKHGFLGLPGAKGLFLRAITAATIMVSLGYYRDIQYPQFGFRARLE